jgi:nucleoside 2-deoxyribosyltransferase
MNKITKDDDLGFKDWQECRTTIGRLDSILVDLRKVGFSIITGLLTAGSFLGFLGLKAPDSAATPADVSAAVFIAIMVLVTALYCFDTNYQVLLRGAVQRAWELETRTEPRIKITEYLSINATRSKVNYVTLLLYLVLLLTAEGFGLLATRAVDYAGMWHVETFYWIAYVAVAVTIVTLMFSTLVAWPLISKLRGAVALWLIWSLALVVATNVTPPTSAVALWIAGVGAVLASFVVLYWLFVDRNVGLTPPGVKNDHVYLAGPDVFDPDFARIFRDRTNRCRRRKLTAVLPFDHKLKTADAIYRHNLRSIESCGGVIANITPFRGPHCDVGTAFEIGYAVAIGIPVWAFSEDRRSLPERVAGSAAARTDDRGWAIERFGLRENLMVAQALRDREVYPNFESAAKAAAKVLLAVESV